MDSAWGNPSSKTFRKRCIRQVRMASCSVLVHLDLADLVAEVLRTVEARGIQLPEKIPGWVPFVVGLDPREFGLSFAKPPGITTSDWPGWSDYTEPDTGTVFMAYNGTPAQALELAGHSESTRVSVLNPQVPKEPNAWQTNLPGMRTLRAGAKGDDVQFLQIALVCPTTDGIYDLAATSAVMALQGRNGLRQTGVMDDDAWKALLPTSVNYRAEYGDTSPLVRLLQAALIAYDWDDDVIPSGRFDQFTLRGVKRLQDNYGMRASGLVAGPEWAALLGAPVRNV